jgi:hypothetical protein
MSYHITRIHFKKQNLSFSEREKFINEEILKQIQSFKQKNLYTQSYEVLNKTSSFFSVRFNLINLEK